jgi:hypothetical protein
LGKSEAPQLEFLVAEQCKMIQHKQNMEEVPEVESMAKVARSPSSKKPYLRPCLSVYGNIEKITQNGGKGPTGDNRTKANHKTGG